MANKQKPLALVAGAGPCLGEVLMKRFSDGGYLGIGLASSERMTADGLRVLGTDLTNPDQATERLVTIMQEHGAPKVVIHNPAKLFIEEFAKTKVKIFEETWRSMALSAVLAAQSVLPFMVAGGGDRFIVSGSTVSLRGGALFSAFASAKFVLRGLTQ
jgi:NAD(P)-dependent dehydrogenase (short-subunit alcohol dehydrogenase family)